MKLIFNELKIKDILFLWIKWTESMKSHEFLWNRWYIYTICDFTALYPFLPLPVIGYILGVAILSWLGNNEARVIVLYVPLVELPCLLLTAVRRRPLKA